MSSTQGSSGVGCNTKKSERCRRCWTPMEEATLIVAMKELIANGWKSDNGFRAGYLTKLEEALRAADPSTDLRALPHVNSKLCSWKKNYYSITGMLQRTGVGFNLRGTNMVDAEDDQWEQMIRVDPNVRLMRHKMWPHYEDWREIFGKDRATGEHAEDIPEAENEFRNNEPPAPDADNPLGNETSFENEIDTDCYDQISQSARDVHASRSSTKKAKVNAELQGVCELLAEMNQATNSRIEQLATRIGYEFDMGIARQETFEQLGDIPGLSQQNRFNVCELIAFKAERLDIWRGMKMDARAQYVEHLIKQHGIA